MEAEESQNSDSEETPSDEKVIICHPKIVSGECDHYYQWVFTDPEGVENARCTRNCWMGIRYKKEEYELVNGQLRRISNHD